MADLDFSDVINNFARSCEKRTPEHACECVATKVQGLIDLEDARPTIEIFRMIERALSLPDLEREVGQYCVARGSHGS